MGTRLIASARPAAIAGVLLATPSQAIAPTLLRMEPMSVAPHTAFSLVLHGAGFEKGAKVRVETNTVGRFLAYRPVELSGERCVVGMPLGFGPEPARRRIYLENPDGGTSGSLVLEIGRPHTAQSEKGPPGESAEPGHDGPGGEAVAGEEGPSSEVPVITELHPTPVPAGRAFVLQVHGSNFTADSEVLVAVNVHAGSTRLPEYSLRPFSAHFVDGELLEVEFDRGFYPIPGARDVVVRNPDGVLSTSAVMTIGAEVGP